MACVAFLLLLLTACSEESNEVEEFPNWQATNESYFNNLYNQVKNQQAGEQWKVFTCWSMEESVATEPEDHIVVRVIETGDGAQPIFSDSVNVVYSGRLLPSTSSPTGYVFDKTFEQEYSLALAASRGFRISSTSLTPGFATALQYMHVGDRWEVYIPHALAYGNDGNSTAGIPAYSTLIMDMTLTKVIHE